MQPKDKMLKTNFVNQSYFISAKEKKSIVVGLPTKGSPFQRNNNVSSDRLDSATYIEVMCKMSFTSIHGTGTAVS